MTSHDDDGTVVVMEYEYVRRRRVTLQEYLAGEETNQPFELYGDVVREPAAPSWSHQRVVGRLLITLDHHVHLCKLGRVVQSPVDVVLDCERPVVVQPDLVFIAAERLHICTDRVWGAPDLAIEVLSVGTARHDSTVKLSWFQRYGVRECWLVDPVERKVYVVSLTPASRSTVAYGEEERIRSTVLPQLDLLVGDLFT